MVEIWLPYGSSEIPARIPEERLVDILKPQKAENILDPAAEINRIIKSGSDFVEAAKRSERTCLVLGPSSNAQLLLTLTQTLLESLSALGASPGAITLLRTADAPALDPALPSEVTTSVHNPLSSTTVPLADSKWQFPLALNSAFIQADFRVILGELKPHHFLRHSGLCDTVFPALASRDSAQRHMSDRKDVAAANLHEERVEIANSFENLYALGFVLDANLSPAKISLGSFQSCLKELEKTVQVVCSRSVERTADVVIMSAGGRPMDESLLSAVETFPAVLPALRKDGVMIVAAECPSGHGNTEFYQWCAEHKEPRYLEARLRHNFNYQGFKAAFLSRTLENHRIYLVSTIPDHYVEDVFGMRTASTVNAALQTVQRSLGSSSTISVAPDASRIILTRTEPGEAK